MEVDVAKMLTVPDGPCSPRFQRSHLCVRRWPLVFRDVVLLHEAGARAAELAKEMEKARGYKDEAYPLPR